MITAYELYLRKQANELAEGIPGLLHLIDDVPALAHMLHHGQHVLPATTPDEPTQR